MKPLGGPAERVKLNLARLKKAGLTFEINIDPDLAIRFKKGEPLALREILKAEHIFSNAHQGLLAPASQLKEVFQTTDTFKIAETIIKEGEIQLTTEYRAEQREQKKRKLIELIRRQAVDSTTRLPLPPQRIELAFEQAKLRIDDFKSPEEQLNTILTQLRPFLPLKIEQSRFILTLPPQYAPKAYSLVQKYAQILKENWNSDGSWTATLEIPAGLKLEFLDKLNSMTHGEIAVEEKDF